MSTLKANRIENLTTTNGGIDINNSGNVGVGASSPGANLEVRGSSSNGQIRIGGSTSGTYSQIYSDNDGVLILNADQGNNAASSYLGFNVDNSERLRIDSSGNVGIGTSAPGHPLTVKGIAAFEATNSTNDWVAYTHTDNTFRLNYNGAGADEVVIDSDGNVGIGEDSPDTRLHIKESTTGGTGIFIQNKNGATNSSADLYFGNWNGSSTSTPQARIQAINTNVNNASTDLVFWTYTGSSIGERMRIGSSGNVVFKNSSY